MTARELRRKYLEFFESKGHSRHPSGSLIPYDVTGKLDESLLFNGAGMVQFKPYFRGLAEPPSPRLVTTQKCVRTGDIESVGNRSHLTFFEMLGNFSFGDYFKREAIAFSWEFLTGAGWLGLDPARLAFTVFSEDSESAVAWKEVAGSEARVYALGEETNYWPAGAFSNGPPGPCGPNSEMFYWTADEPPPAGGYGVEDFVRDEAAGRWLEVWNDVFIQYEWKGRPRDPERPAAGFEKSGLDPLPFASVDTGMGLERTAAVLGGYESVYETDVFAPILRIVQELGTGLRYGADADADRAMRIVADHIRTACFCIADGILPGNTGRGYVLRRLIRRAVLKGERVLGFREPFFHRVFAGVHDALGDHYEELTERAAVIEETLRSEEDQFRRTVQQGAHVLAEWFEAREPGAALSGDDAFRLYDTFGFPLEVTQELCAEKGVEVDVPGYERALREAQERSRGAGGMETVYGGVAVVAFFQGADKPTPTDFVGYDATEVDATIVGALPAGDGSNHMALALDRTPFYAESGGQVSDTGTLTAEGLELRVLDLTKQDAVYVHLVEPVKFNGSPEDLFGLRVRARIDEERRADIARNHTATHLLHAALRRVLGEQVTQAGSLVAPEHLRFDFSHGKAMTPDEIAAVEDLVNERILLNDPVGASDGVPIAVARARGAMALFGEKYGEFVRMVDIDDFSIELCGGIHVGRTSEIGLFKIRHEGSAAGGVRRIEAVTGRGFYRWTLEQTATARQAAALLKTAPAELVGAVERTLEQFKEERMRRERAEAALARGDTKRTRKVPIGPVVVSLGTFENVDPKIVGGTLDEQVAASPETVAIAATVGEGSVTFTCKVGASALAAGVHAGNLVKAMAAAAGGGGGGRADYATAGAKDASKVPQALAAAEAAVAEMVGSPAPSS